MITPAVIEQKYRGQLPDSDVDELKRYAQFRIDRAEKRVLKKVTTACRHCMKPATGKAYKEGKSILLCESCRQKQKGLFNGHGYVWINEVKI